MSQYAMIINYEYCTGCHTCEIACRQERGLPVEEWGVKLAEMGPKRIQGEWNWDYVPIRSSVCNYCEERLAEGKKAACEHHCLAQCIRVVPVGKVAEVMVAQEGKVAVFAS